MLSRFLLAVVLLAPHGAGAADAALVERALEVLEAERVAAGTDDPLLKSSALRHRDRLERVLRDSLQEELTRDLDLEREGASERIDGAWDVRIFEGREVQAPERRRDPVADDDGGDDDGDEDDGDDDDFDDLDDLDEDDLDDIDDEDEDDDEPQDDHDAEEEIDEDPDSSGSDPPFADEYE